MKRDGHYYSKFLTEDELTRFKHNFQHSLWNLDDGFFDRGFNNFFDFVSNGFTWGETDEGHWYWHTISSREVDDQEFYFKRVSKHSMTE